MNSPQPGAAPRATSGETPPAAESTPAETGPAETAPSVWPLTLAGGVTLMLWGFASSYAFTVVGLAIIAGALAGWIGQLRQP